MPKSRRRKRPQTRTPRRTAPLTWQARVLQEARALLDPSASRHDAELWASRTLGRASQGRRWVRDTWVADVTRYADRRRTREAAVFVAALSTVLDTPSLGEARATWADALLHDVPWARSPRLRPDRVLRAGDTWGDHVVWFLEHPSHTLAVITSRCRRGRVTGLYVSGPRLVAAWNLLARGTDDEWQQCVEVHVEESLAHLRRAHDLTDSLVQRDPTFRELGPLLGARVAGVEPAGVALGRAEADELFHGFLEHLGRRDDPVVEELSEHLLDFTSTYLPDDPLAWSPGLVTELLYAWAPYLELDEEAELLMPSVVCHWVRWCLQRKGLDEHRAREVGELALRFRAGFHRACEEARRLWEDDLDDDLDDPAA